MDARNLDFEIGELVQWIELCAEGFLVRDRGLGIVVEKYNHFYRVHRPIQQDVVNFNLNELEKVNESK